MSSNENSKGGETLQFLVFKIVLAENFLLLNFQNFHREGCQSKISGLFFHDSIPFYYYVIQIVSNSTLFPITSCIVCKTGFLMCGAILWSVQKHRIVPGQVTLTHAHVLHMHQLTKTV